MERTVLITTSLCKTAHLGRIASHYEFAPIGDIRSRIPPVVRKNSIRAIGAEYEHESHGMMSA